VDSAGLWWIDLCRIDLYRIDLCRIGRCRSIGSGSIRARPVGAPK
jgi:hypothetical protein